MGKLDNVGYKLLRMIFTVSVWATVIAASFLRLAEAVNLIGLIIGLYLYAYVESILKVVFPTALFCLSGLFMIRYLKDREAPRANSVARLGAMLSPWFLKLDVAYLAVLLVWALLIRVRKLIMYHGNPDLMEFLGYYLGASWPFLILAAVFWLVQRVCSNKLL